MAGGSCETWGCGFFDSGGGEKGIKRSLLEQKARKKCGAPVIVSTTPAIYL